MLDVEKNRPDAVLLQARALAEAGTTTSRRRQQQQQAAVARLQAAIKADPRFDEAYHTLAEIHLKRDRNEPRPSPSWRDDLKANPDDTTAVVRLVEMLALRQPGGQPPADGRPRRGQATSPPKSPAATARATMILALAIGFHRAGQLELAFPHAEAAAAKLDTPAAHLNFGDLLLTIAESQSDPSRARASFERAVEQYDLVLKAQPNSVEAVNNKAWILHTYLGKVPERPRHGPRPAETRERRRSPGRVLRHFGCDPGVDRSDRRRRAILPRGLEEGRRKTRSSTSTSAS